MISLLTILRNDWSTKEASEVLQKQVNALWNAKIVEILQFFLNLEHEFPRSSEKLKQYRDAAPEEEMEVEKVFHSKSFLTLPGTRRLARNRTCRRNSDHDGRWF